MNIQSLEGMTNAEIAADNMTAEIAWKMAYELLVAKVPNFKTYRRTPALRVEPFDLPMLTIYLVREREENIGDPNHGDPSFKHHVHFGIEGVINVSDVDDQLILLARHMHACRTALYTDAVFVKNFEGIESSDMRLVWNRTGENPTGGYQMELVLCFSTLWPPLVTDDYKTLHLETRYPSWDTDPNQVMQIKRTWDIPQE
jgi:hypothetical protein